MNDAEIETLYPHYLDGLLFTVDGVAVSEALTAYRAGEAHHSVIKALKTLAAMHAVGSDFVPSGEAYVALAWRETMT
jgi:hypothetical protein